MQRAYWFCSTLVLVSVYVTQAFSIETKQCPPDGDSARWTTKSVDVQCGKDSECMSLAMNHQLAEAEACSNRLRACAQQVANQNSINSTHNNSLNACNKDNDLTRRIESARKSAAGGEQRDDNELNQVNRHYNNQVHTNQDRYAEDQRRREIAAEEKQRRQAEEAQRQYEAEQQRQYQAWQQEMQAMQAQAQAQAQYMQALQFQQAYQNMQAAYNAARQSYYMPEPTLSIPPPDNSPNYGSSYSGGSVHSQKCGTLPTQGGCR
jgi:hypothetical protein